MFVLLASSIFSHAQLSEGGTPASFTTGNSLRNTPEPVNIPIKFNVEDLKLVDEWQVSQGAPLRLATIIDTTLTIEKNGTWSTLNDGLHVWQLRIKADNAIALMILYNKFLIPETGKLFIYNAGKTHILGAYTHKTHSTPGKFATEFIAGDDIIFEYETTDPEILPELEIEGIGYGYNHLSVSSSGLSTRASGSCMVNINCEEGANWQDVKNGVCKMTQKIGSSVYLCSGVLMNNTARDYAPYIMSAYHCSEGGGQIASESDYSYWTFYFHYEREGCDNNSPISSESFSMVGCKKMMVSDINGGSDGMLLLLNQEIPAGTNVYFNGWDRSTTPATSGVGIHHPAGDVMKISTFNSTLTNYTWYDGENRGATNAHWDAIFVQTANGHSVTAGGSSGSPLYNANKLVIGTLSGGDSDCDGKKEGHNVYGKFSYHWDDGMSSYLDPNRTNVSMLTGMYMKEIKAAPQNLQLSYNNDIIQLNWNAPTLSEKPVKYRIYKNYELLDETSDISFTDKVIENANIIYSISAVYQDGEESATVSKTIMITDYKAPTDIKVELRGWSVNVSWQAPIYEQTAYWGNWEDSGYVLGYDKSNAPFYFGQAWTPEDLEPVNKKTITAIRFFAQRGVTYSIYIKQGERIHRQPLSNISTGEFHTVPLTTSFAIDASETLIVSLYATGYGNTNFPAALDKGPAVNNKGNVISLDGEEWSISGQDYNFMVSMTISSEEKTITQTAKERTSLSIHSEYTESMIAIQKRETISSIQTLSQPVVSFPEITNYNIYRNGVLASVINSTTTEFTDYGPGAGDYTYSVSALYGNIQSSKVESEQSITVDNENISPDILRLTPTLFHEQVTVISADPVTLVEVYSIDGRKHIHLTYPDTSIPTGGLPAGLYIFRIHTDKEIKTIKGVKQR
ncbi:MAG: T9SS type A sorting domain-containing protein [Tannerellaceae bacterium]|nr:T9SS type A sorting domain-containing protein [Tannerellaceae bacterium]